MTTGPAVLRAIDAALDVVERAERRGLHTRDDVPAAAELARLRQGLAEERDRVRNGGDADVDALGALVRDVAGWTPEGEIRLLAALGAVVQAARH
ncbi:MAG TPA: hypothetical protein VFT96_12370 [Gemmatimonadaceae bacterium]|nr:hypothetical protein [Gemmatimonadaceae bacterium]